MKNSNWQLMKLEDFVSVQRGYDLPETQRRPGNIPVIGSAGINGYHDTARAKAPGVTIGRSGASIGVVTYSSVDYFPHNACLFVTDFHGNDERFAYYLLQTLDFKSYNSGSAQPSLNRNYIYQIDVKVPSLPIQKRVADILSAYDDLIENNTRRIKILEEMAQLLYREWFVNFRFPGHQDVPLVESELGLIPQYWEVKKLKDFGEIITGKTPSKKNPDLFGDFIPFIKTPDMHGNVFCIETGEFLSKLGATSQKSKTIPLNSLCVSCIGTAGVVTITSMNSQTNQQINSLVPSSLFNREFLYFSLLSLKEIINQYGSNGATMVNLNKSKFEALQVIAPSSHLVNKFHQVAYPTFELIKVLQLKNISLRKTRDLLLPKLILGEIDVESLDTTVADDLTNIAA